MADKIIDVEATAVQDEPTDKTLKLIDGLNEQVSNNSGTWTYAKDIGLCWVPNPASMPGSPPPTAPDVPSSLVELIKWGDSLDFDNIGQNAVVLIKLNITDQLRVQMMQKIITKHVLEPRIEKLKDKRVCILFMQSDDDISIMTEEDMNKAGWVKKEPSRIITL